MLHMDVQHLCYAKAAERNIPPAHLAAVVDVESNGIVYGPTGDHLPMILFEPHKLYARLSGAARDEAVALKLASKFWNKKLYPKSQQGRWQQIADAVAVLKRHGLDPNIAAECASYGVGQVLGEHWDNLGFASFSDFYNMMVSGAEGQIEIMLRFIEVNHLDDDLREGRWPTFFRGYNGPQWAKNKYGQKIEAALALYGGGSTSPDGMLRMGAKGPKVRELQALLARAGYQIKVDGDFGPSTRDALKAFQKANKITVDGVAGPQTQKALAKLRQGEGDKPGAQSIPDIKEIGESVVVGGGGTLAIETAKQTVEAAKDDVVNLGVSLPIVDFIIAGLGTVAAVLAVAAIGYGLYGWWKSKKSVEV